MIKKNNTLCIIPARGGSKRIPRKNIHLFRGKPLIAWSIEIAQSTGLFDTIMVSSDDPEILAIASLHGADVPFIRSELASNDDATTCAVLTEVLAEYEQLGRSFSRACCLYPTAILASPDDLKEGLETLDHGQFDVMMPVTKFDYPIQRGLARYEDGRLSLIYPEFLDTRSQDLDERFHDAGQWYWFKVPEFKLSGQLLGAKTGSLLIPRSRVQDIDDFEDLRLAEMKFVCNSEIQEDGAR